MAKTPNYDFERREREKAKAAKKAEKLAEKQAARERNRVQGEGEDGQRRETATDAE